MGKEAPWGWIYRRSGAGGAMEATEVAWGFGFDSDRHVRGVRGGRERQKARKMGCRQAGSGLPWERGKEREGEGGAGLGLAPVFFLPFVFFFFQGNKKKREE